MVKDKNNQIYTGLMEYMKDIYPKLKSSQTYPDSPPSFPYLYFFQIDSPTALRTLSNTEDGVHLSFQIELYSDKGMNEARKMADDVREYMISEGFECKRHMPSQVPSNSSRFITVFYRLDV